jgi:hypothetical protein
MEDQTRTEVLRIALTAEQSEQVKSITGRTIEAISFTVRELEPRIAPRLAANHNETLLLD